MADGFNSQMGALKSIMRSVNNQSYDHLQGKEQDVKDHPDNNIPNPTNPTDSTVDPTATNIFKPEITRTR